MSRSKPRAGGRKPEGASQGLSGLGIWRIPFSADVKRRRQQTHENRRPHRLRGPRPDSVLGAPEAHWSSPPRLGRGGRAGATAPGAKLKGSGAVESSPTLLAGPIPRRKRHRSLRHGKRASRS